MRNVILMSMILVVAAISHATDYDWDGGGADNLWSTAENWVGDVLPTAPISDARIESGSCQINSGTDISMSAHLYLGGSDQASGNATLTMNGGSMVSSGGYCLIGYNNGDLGQVYLNGGTMTYGGLLGLGLGWYGTGNLVIAGGTMNVNRVNTSFKSTSPGGSVLTIHGGALNVTGYFNAANFDATPGSSVVADSINIDGGSLTVGDYFDVGRFGTCAMTLSGNGNVDITGNFILGGQSSGVGTLDMSGGTLECGLLKIGSAGHGAIDLTGGALTADDLSINTGMDSYLNIAGGTLYLTGEILDITVYGNVLAFGQQGLFNYNYDSTNNVTAITAAPEPATLALLGLGGLLIRRRR